jgi:hypothetical protein
MRHGKLCAKVERCSPFNRAMSPELKNAIADAIAGEATLVVEFEVSDLLGKRYWSAPQNLVHVL